MNLSEQIGERFHLPKSQCDAIAEMVEGKMENVIDLLAYLDYRAHAQKNGEMAWHWWALVEPIKDHWRKVAERELIGDENPPKEPPNPNSDPLPPAKESEKNG